MLMFAFTVWVVILESKFKYPRQEKVIGLLYAMVDDNVIAALHIRESESVSPVHIRVVQDKTPESVTPVKVQALQFKVLTYIGQI